MIIKIYVVYNEASDTYKGVKPLYKREIRQKRNVEQEINKIKPLEYKERIMLHETQYFHKI